MNRRALAYGSVLTGLLTAITTTAFYPDLVVIALSFPFGALMFAVVWLAAEWRPRRGRS